MKIVNRFYIADISGEPKEKTALLISPPVYDTQYWSEWSQPYGLLRITSLLRKHQYKRLELFDFIARISSVASSPIFWRTASSPLEVKRET